MIISGKYAASNFIYQQGIQIDLQRGQFKMLRSLFGFIRLKDEWKPLPKIAYVLVFKTFYVKCEPCEQDDTHSATMQVSLVYNKNRKLIVHEATNKDEIFSIAEALASHLQLKIRDAATNRRAPRWVTCELTNT